MFDLEHDGVVKASAAQRRPEENDGSGPKDAARLLPILASGVRRHRYWVIGAALIALAATAIIYFAIPRLYTARADVWLDQGFGRTMRGAADPIARNTEIRLLTSNDLAAQVVERLGLANVRGFGQPSDGQRRPPALARRIAIATVKDNVAVRPTGTSYAVSVRYDAADPVLAAGVLNQLIDDYVEDRRIGGERGRAREMMRAQVAAAREDTIRAQAAIDGYRAATSLVAGAADAGPIRAEVSGLKAEVIRIKIEQRRAEARLHAGTGTISPRLRELRSQQDELRSQRRGPGTGQAAIADARLETIGRDVDVESNRLQEFVKAEDVARGRVKVISSALARVQDQQRASSQAAAKISQLSQDAQTARARLADLAGRFNALVAAQRGTRGTAYVISRAQPRSARSFPNLLLFTLGGWLAALLAAGLVVLVRELRTKGFRDGRHAEHVLGVPVIGLVPDLAKVRGADIPVDDPMAPADYLFNNQRSTFSAAFRAIHTGLRLGGERNGMRVVAISSAFQGEGKTTVAICLARSAALAGLRVLLVDCDARRPAASRALSAYTPIGLDDVLEGRVPFRQALQTDTPSGAWFLAQGTDNMVFQGTKRVAAMKELIDVMRREFDLVVLDSPPALALVEAREIAAMADAVLLVARARQTPVDATKLARDELAKAGAKVTAMALTLVAP